jgi:hypothetical protein
MAADRAQARRRVRVITGWAAAGAAALTAGFAFGASRGDHVAKSTTAAPANNGAEPQDPGFGGYSPAPDQSAAPQRGFTPPSSSNGPPAGMSGGS